MAVRGSLSKTSSQIKYFFSLRDVNRELEKENQRLLSSLESFRNAGTSADTSEAQYIYIPARIVANSTNIKQNFIIIDKGSRDGVKEDMGVISPQGVA